MSEGWTTNFSSWTTNWSGWTTGGGSSGGSGGSFSTGSARGNTMGGYAGRLNNDYASRLHRYKPDQQKLEQAVRSSRPPDHLPGTLRKKRPPAEPPAGPDPAIIEWGKGNKEAGEDPFDETDDSGRSYGRSSSKTPQERPKEPEKELRYIEEKRTTNTKRITSSSDSSVYVDVARITEITFRGPDNRNRVFELKPPP